MSKNAIATYGSSAPLFRTTPAIPAPKWWGIDIKPLTSGETRVIFYVILAIGTYLTSVLAESAMRNAARRRLKAKSDVRAVHLGGWMSIDGLCSWVLRCKSLPGGPWFIPMSLTALIFVLANLSIAAYTTEKAVNTRCFGPVDFATADTFVGYPEAWPPTEPAFGNMLQTQAYSKANGGYAGLYWAAPVIPNFRASANDIAATWLCDNTFNSSRTVSTDSKATNATLHSYVGPYNYTYECTNFGPQANEAADYSCAAVSTDFRDPYNLRLLVAIDVPPANNSFPAHANYDVGVAGYNCTLVMNGDTLLWLRDRMDGVSFSSGLADLLNARLLYDQPAQQEVMELISNAMLSLYTYATLESPSLVNGALYGCVVAGSRVELPACILLGLSLFAFLVWLAVSVVMKIMAWGLDFRCPLGLIGWMDQAIHEAADEKDATCRSDISPKRRLDWVLTVDRNLVAQTGEPAIQLVDHHHPFEVK